MKYFVKIANGKQEPVTDEDFKKSLKIKEGDFLTVETWKERNVEFHKKYFALLKCAINIFPEDEAFDPYRNLDSLRKEIMLQNNRFDTHETLGGKKSYIPHSISFRSMDNEKFEEIYSEALDTLLKHFLKFVSREDFEQHIMDFL